MIQRRLKDPGFSTHSKDALREWLVVIERRGVAGVIEVLEDRSEDATRMRQSSPFAVLMPQDERMKILRRYEAFRTRTIESEPDLNMRERLKEALTLCARSD